MSTYISSRPTAGDEFLFLLFLIDVYTYVKWYYIYNNLYFNYHVSLFDVAGGTNVLYIVTFAILIENGCVVLLSCMFLHWRCNFLTTQDIEMIFVIY